MTKGDEALDPARAQAVFDELLAGSWSFHGWAPDVEVSWALVAPALEALYDLVRPGACTLETGAGLSTVVFALKGAHHTVVSPWAHEHDRILRWCAERDVPTGRLTFLAQPSQEALPSLGGEPLDLVLIDGDHAFPAPFIDWYYTARRLRVGGLLMVDDTHLRTGAVLRDFLHAEAGRWRSRTQLPTTEIFERTSDVLIPDVGWEGQPWCVPASGPLPSRLRVGLSRLRARARLRTRLRGLARRIGAQR